MNKFDPSHDIVNSPGGQECANCWGCTCHSPELLKEPCRGLDFLRKK